MLNIFLDDDRPVPTDYLVMRDGEALINFLTVNRKVAINILALDHDLGDNTISGYDVVKILVNTYPEVFDTISHILVHSNNVVGRDNMLAYLTNAQKHGVISTKCYIDTGFYQYSGGIIHKVSD